MSERTLSKLVAPMFDANILEPLIFSSFQDAVQELVEEAGPDMPNVCIGPPATAMPTYFPAHYFDIWVSDMEPAKYHLIDGGNNPTMAAISKITREQLLKNPEFHPSGMDYMKYLVISVGAWCAVHENVPAKQGAFNWFHSRRNSHSPVTDTSSHASACWPTGRFACSYTMATACGSRTTSTSRLWYVRTYVQAINHK